MYAVVDKKLTEPNYMSAFVLHGRVYAPSSCSINRESFACCLGNDYTYSFTTSVVRALAELL